VIFDKHFLNLMWNDLVQSFVFNDKIKYFVTFLCDFIKRLMIYVLRVKSSTLNVFKHFQQHNEHEDNWIHHFRINWKEEYFNEKFINHCFKHDIEWESIVSKTSKQNEVVERLKQILMSMINIMLKNVDLNNKWWIELITTFIYFRNRSSMINKSIILFEVDTKRKFFLASFRRIETTSYVMKRKSVTKWKKLAFRSFFVVFVNYERNHIYRMLRFNEIIYRVSFVTWIKKSKKIMSFHFWNIDKTIDHEINHIFDEKTSFKVEFNNYFHVLISARSINWCRFTLFSILNNESKHIKHRVNLVNFDSQRFKTSFRVTLSFRLLWFSKSFDHEMHKKRHRFATNFKIKIIQENNERFKSKKMNKDYEERKHLSFDQWNLNTDQFFKNRRVFRDKWVYKIKKEKHDEILRYKTRWMIRRFEQIEKLNYTKTFLSMIKSMNYKTMYVIIVVNDWEIEQMNVKTIFLYDNIHENVFVVQFTKFEQKINKICKLNKIWYDLKQFSKM
jgi:hypothetical protein